MHCFFERGGKTFRGEVSKWLNLQDKPSKKRKTREQHFERDPDAQAFFLEQTRRGGALSSDKVDDMLDALEVLKSEASILSKNTFNLARQDILAHASSEQCGEEGYRQRWVVQRYYRTESKTRDAEIDRRLSLVLLEYEIRRLQSTAFCGTTAEGVSSRGIPEAEEQFARLSRLSKEDVPKLRTHARPFVHVSSYQNGLGLIYLLGPQTRGA